MYWASRNKNYDSSFLNYFVLRLNDYYDGMDNRLSMFTNCCFYFVILRHRGGLEYVSVKVH